MRIALGLSLVFVLAAFPGCNGEEDPVALGPDATDSVQGGPDTPEGDIGPGDDADPLTDVADIVADPDTTDATEALCEEDSDCLGSLSTCEKFSCIEKVCEVVTKTAGEACDDGDKCTTGDVCNSEGTCLSGIAKECLDNVCTLNEQCDQADGACKSDPAGTDVLCDDGDACTVDDYCDSGKCIGGGASPTCKEDCHNNLDDDKNTLIDCNDFASCGADPGCLGKCLIIDTLTCGQTLSVDPAAVAGSDNIDVWQACGGAVLPGREFAWSTIATSGVEVTVSLTNAPVGATLSLLEVAPGVATSTCLKADCKAQSPTSVTFTQNSKTRQVVVDAPEDAAAAFDLTMTCAACSPNCNGKACGSDGCGGSCGACGAGTSCNAGTCQLAAKNDTCETATIIPASPLPYFASGTTGNATDNTTLPSQSGCPGSNDVQMGFNGKDVAYRFTPTQTGEYLIALDSDFAGAVYVVSDCAQLGATCIGAAGDGSDGVHSVVVQLTNGTPYFIIVDAHAGALSGSYTLTVNAYPCTGSCGTKTCGPNGCAGSCGSCAAGKVCNAVGACATPAANDGCVSAQAISTVPFSGSGETSAADDDFFVYPETCPGGPVAGQPGADAPDLVYRFTPPANGRFRVTLTPQAFDAVLSVTSACPANLQQCLAGSDAPGSGSPETAEVILSKGESVWLIVDGAEPQQAGSFDLDIEQLPCTPECGGKACGDDACGGVCGTCPAAQGCTEAGQCAILPANDNCLSPTSITGLPFTFDGDTTAATNDYSIGLTKACKGGPASATYGKGPDVCFVYTATVDGKVKLFTDTAGTTFPTYIYATDAPGSFTEDTCDASSYDPVLPGVAVLIVDLKAGQTAYVVLDGWQSKDKGAFTFKAEVFP